FELDEAANRIRGEVDPDANIIVGSTLDPEMDGQMRVSVVATGIDVLEGEKDVPVVAPRRVAEPVQRVPEPVVEAPVEAEPEVPAGPAFVDSHVASTPAEPDFFEEAPAPAPEPEVAEAAAPRQPGEQVERPRRPGEPTPEALRRLQAAVAKVPEAQQPVAPQHTPRPQAEEGGRFAINSLIHRMTGQSGGQREERAPQSRVATPPLTAPTQHHDQDVPTDQRDRNEIPAFLRRQAN
ncbi:MAG: cell division protein FtsZ, partial [Pseudomonadota bacterium]